MAKPRATPPPRRRVARETTAERPKAAVYTEAARAGRRAHRPTEIAGPSALAKARAGIDRSTADDGPSRAVLDNLVAICEAELTAVVRHRTTATALAAQLGGDDAFRWHLCELRAAIAAPATAPAEDWIRERYGELVDRHRAEPERIDRLRSLGDAIRELERSGVLPSTLVVRSPRTPRSRRPTA